MNELTVRIVRLEPLRVASFYGFGPNPEYLAVCKLVAWAEPRGYLADRPSHRIFGFNNPNPTAASPNYGYEFWIVVGPEDTPEDDMRILDFSGGLYAVTRCQGVQEIALTWGRLVQWLTDSHYGHAEHQWLEEHLDRTFPEIEEEILLDLYAPIVE